MISQRHHNTSLSDLLPTLSSGVQIDSRLLLPFTLNGPASERCEANALIGIALMKHPTPARLKKAYAYIRRAWFLSGYSETLLALYVDICSLVNNVEAARDAYKRIGVRRANQGDLPKAIEYFNCWQNAYVITGHLDQYDYDQDILDVIATSAKPLSFRAVHGETAPDQLSVAYLIKGITDAGSALVNLTLAFAERHNKDKIVASFYVPESEKEVMNSPAGQIHVEKFRTLGFTLNFAPEGPDFSHRLYSVAESINTAHADILVTVCALADFAHYYIMCLQPARVNIALAVGPPAQFVAPSHDWAIGFLTHPLLDSPCGTTYCNVIHALPDVASIPAASRLSMGIPADACVLFTSGRTQKFQNKAMWEAMGSILAQNNSAWLVVVGAEPHSIPALSSLMPESSIRKIRMFHWRSDYLNMAKASDIVIDTYPNGGGGCLAFTVALGLPFVSFLNDYEKMFDQRDWMPAEDFLNCPELLVPHGDYNSFIAVTNRLINDLEFRHKMTLLSNESLRRRFNNQSVNIQQIETIYRDVYSRKACTLHEEQTSASEVALQLAIESLRKTSFRAFPLFKHLESAPNGSTAVHTAHEIGIIARSEPGFVAFASRIEELDVPEEQKWRLLLAFHNARGTDDEVVKFADLLVGRGQPSPNLHYQKGMALLRMRQRDAAARSFIAEMSTYPEGQSALAAAHEVGALSLTMSSLSSVERTIGCLKITESKRLELLLAFNHSRHASAEVIRIAKALSSTGETYHQLHFFTGEAFMQEARYEEAYSSFLSEILLFPDAETAMHCAAEIGTLVKLSPGMDNFENRIAESQILESRRRPLLLAYNHAKGASAEVVRLCALMENRCDDLPDLLYYKGIALRSLGRTQDAANAFVDHITGRPEAAVDSAHAAGALTGMLPTRANIITRIEALPLAHLHHAKILLAFYHSLGEPEKVIDQAKVLIDAKVTFPSLHLYKALALKQIGLKNDAVEAFFDELSRYPDSSISSAQELGALVSEVPSLVNFEERVTSLHLEDTQTYQILLAFYYAQRSAPETVRFANLLLSQQCFFPSLLHQKAVGLRILGRNEEAAETFFAEIVRYPASAADSARELGLLVSTQPSIQDFKNKIENTPIDDTHRFKLLLEYSHARGANDDVIRYSGLLQGANCPTPNLFYFRGMALRRSGRDEEAVESFLSEISTFPDTAIPSARELGSMESALRLRTDIVGRLKSMPLTEVQQLKLLLTFHHTSGAAADTLDHANRLLTLNCSFPNLHYYRGVAFQRLGMTKESIDALLMEISAFPEFASAAALETGKLASQSSSLSSVRQSIEKLQLDEPQRSRVLIPFYHSSKLSNDVILRSESLIDRHISFPGLLYFRGDALRDVGRAVEAYDALIAETRAFPHEDWAFSAAQSAGRLAALYPELSTRKNDLRELDSHPLLSLWFDLSFFHTKSLSDEAVLAADALLERQVSRPGLHFYRGIALRKKGRLDEAERCFEKEIHLYGENGYIVLQKAILLRSRGCSIPAKEELRRALEVYPETEWIRCELGLILETEGNSREAFELFSSENTLFPGKTIVKENLLRVQAKLL